MSDTVEIVIKAKDEASGTIGNVSRALGGIGGAARTVGRVAAGAFVGVGAAAVGGFGLALRESINMNASLEQSTMMFTTLMGDAELAEQHVASLFEFAARTPFNTDEIIQASKHFQVFGGEALNTLENLTLVGDAAAAVGAPFDEVAFWVGRAYSAIQGGQPFGEAAMRLQELGLMSPEVRAEMEKLQETGADADQVWGAFSGNLENFGGAMELQSQSWNGMMETLKDSLSMAAAEGLKPFFDIAKGGLEWLVNSGAIERVGSIFSNFFKLIATAPDEGGPLMDYLQELPGWLQPIGVFFAETAIVISSFFANLQEGMSPLNAFIEAIWDIAPQPVLDALIALRDDVLPRVTEAFQQFVAPLITAAGEFVSFKDVLIAGAIAIGAALIPVIIGIITAIAPIVLTVAGVIAVVALLRNAWEQNWGGIQEKTAAAVEFIKGVIQAALDFIKQYWADNGARIVSQAQADLEALRNAFTSAIERVKQIVSDALAGMKQFWADHGAAIVDTATKAWDLIKGVFDGVTKQLNLIGEAFRLAFEGDWEAFGKKIFELWENAWDTVVDFLRGLWDMVLPWLQSLWQAISGWFSSTDWGSLGRAIIDGIANGLKNAAGALYDIVRGIVQGIRDAAGAAAGEGSPARLFIPLGEAIGQGIIVGIQNTAGDMMATLEGLMKNISSVAGLGGAFANLFEARNITPLEFRANQLRGELGNVTAELDEILKEYGLSSNTAALREILTGQMGASPLAGNESELRKALTYLDARESLLKRQKQIEDDLIRNQNELLRLEAARANFGFLQQQFELLKMVRDNNLGAEILEGLQLGIGADPGALMQAMVRAMEAMIRAAENELGIASPSKWAQRTMENVMGTMADTVRRGSPAVADGLALTPARSLPEQFFGRVGNTTTINIDARGAERGAAGDIRRVVEQVLREQGTRADIRMRTT